MCMTDVELDNNFYVACLKYANCSSFGVDFQEFQSQLSIGSDSQGHATIDYWGHPSSQPSRAVLKAYNLTSLDAIQRINAIALNPAPALKPLALTELKTVAAQPWTPNYLMAARLDGGQPIILINGVWYIILVGPLPL